ncbi:MAG: preprotein translocase subunit SecY [bacterium]
MLSGFRDIFRIPELKKRVLFTLTIIAVFRIGAFVPTPGIDTSALVEYFARMQGTLFGMADLFSGGALRKLSIFALGIMPYISASIIMQLLTPVIPYLEKLSKEGDFGRKKITQYTRYGTIVVSIIQSTGISLWLSNPHSFGGLKIVPNPGLYFHFIVVITLTTGTVFIMWLGEQITERGIGNGISLIIFAGIVAGMPGDLRRTWGLLDTGQMRFFTLIFLIAIMIVVIAAVVLITQGYRKIPVQYAKRIVGRKMYGGQNTHIPLRVNQAGVIPIIFAVSIMMFPQTIMTFLPAKSSIIGTIVSYFSMNQWPGMIMYVVLIILFTYFYTAITFNPVEMADNMKKYGGFVPGVRPGKPTAEYFDRIMTKIAFAGGIFLGAIAILPTLLTKWLNIPFYFGGTSLLIVVGVALDTMKQVESHLLMRHYEGFMKKGRLRARY